MKNDLSIGEPVGLWESKSHRFKRIEPATSGVLRLPRIQKLHTYELRYERFPVLEEGQSSPTHHIGTNAGTRRLKVIALGHHAS
jgi:hypothetical protein